MGMDPAIADQHDGQRKTAQPAASRSHHPPDPSAYRGDAEAYRDRLSPSLAEDAVARRIFFIRPSAIPLRMLLSSTWPSTPASRASGDAMRSSDARVPKGGRR